jgi:hypothetical protein
MPTVVQSVKHDGVRYLPGDTVSPEVAKQLPEGFSMTDAQAKKALAETVEDDSDDDADDE